MVKKQEFAPQGREEEKRIFILVSTRSVGTRMKLFWFSLRSLRLCGAKFESFIASFALLRCKE
jgi:hypothetical protein